MTHARITRLAALLLAVLLLCTLPHFALAADDDGVAATAPVASSTDSATTETATAATSDFGDADVEVSEDDGGAQASGGDGDSNAHPIGIPGLTFGADGGQATDEEVQATLKQQEEARLAREARERLGPAGVTPDTPISLQRTDYCKACYTVVEEFHKWTIRQLHNPNAEERNKTMTRHELVEWFCKTGPFEHWKQPLIHGCIKTMQDHHEEVLAPFLGVHVAQEYTTLAGVFAHKVSVCASPTVDACDAWVPEGRPKNECETCRRLVADLHWSLSREVKVNATIAKKVLGVLCMEAGMRHDKPMEVEAFCHEHVDEHWDELQRMLVKVYNDASIPDKGEAMRNRLCGMLTATCDEDIVKSHKDALERKEKEKKKRMEAREANKIGNRKKKLEAAAAEHKDEL